MATCIETQQRYPPKKIVDWKWRAATSILTDKRLEKMGNRLADLDWVDSFVEKTADFHFAEGFDGVYKPAVKAGYVPVGISNHEAHLNGPEAAVEAEILALRGGLKGFYLPIAASLKRGDQGKGLEVFYKLLTPDFERHNLYTLPVVRSCDHDDFQMKGNNLGIARQLLHAAGEGYGLFFFPEGSVQAGRNKDPKHPVWNNICGMGAVKQSNKNHEEDRLLPAKLIMEIAKKRNNKVLLIPISTHGSYRVWSPDTNFFKLRGIRSALNPREVNPIQVKFGLPLKIEDLYARIQETTQVTPKSFTDAIFREIASGLPDYAKGIYNK